MLTATEETAFFDSCKQELLDEHSDSFLGAGDDHHALRPHAGPDRAALLMHAQDGMPHEAIASALGLSLVAVKVRVHRARIKLRRLCDLNGG